MYERVILLTKIEIIDYNSWSPYEGFAEGSGRSEKIWLQSSEGRIGLFKFPKIDPKINDITTEHISEHIAYQLGLILGVKTAEIALGTYNNRQGCMSYQLNKSNEEIMEGFSFIIGKHPDYDMNTMREKESGRYYCIEHLMEVSDSLDIRNKWLQMMIFDYIIGNTDRHQNNWAVLNRYMCEDKNNIYEACPLYDNGSSLCCYVNGEMIESYLGRDKKRFQALVDSKSQSMIRIDGYVKKHPTHREVVTYLVENFSKAGYIAHDFCMKLTKETINELMDNYSEVLSVPKVELIKRFLIGKMEMLGDILVECGR